MPLMFQSAERTRRARYRAAFGDDSRHDKRNNMSTPEQERESSSPQRTEYGPQGKNSHLKGKPGMGNIITQTGDHQDSLAMSFDYKDSMGSSVVNVFKHLYIPGNNSTVTQDKAEIDDQKCSSSESFEVDAEENADKKVESNDGETRGPGEVDAVDIDKSGAGQTSAEPIRNVTSDDHSGKPDFGEAAQYLVIKILRKYFLRDDKGNQSVLPQKIKYGPKSLIDGNLILDEDEKIFEIVKYEGSHFHFKEITKGKCHRTSNDDEGSSTQDRNDADVDVDTDTPPDRPPKNAPVAGCQDAAASEVRKENSQPCHIIVKNLPQTVDEDHIQLLFENDKKQGGGEVLSVQLNEDKTVAVVEFEDPKAVDIVLNKRPIKIKGQVVDVAACVSSQATNNAFLEDGSDSFPSLSKGHDENYEFLCTICDDKGKVREALFHCETCGHHYCIYCSEGHIKFNIGHTVLGLEEKERWGKSTEFECEDHKQQLTMYCENHDLVCCAVCATVKHRSECDGKVFYIPEIAGKVIKEQEFCEFKEHISRDLVDVTRKTEQKKRFDSTLQPLKTEYRERVKQFTNKINKAVELLKDKSFTEIDNVLDEIDSKTKSEVSACVEIKKELNRIQNLVTNSDDMLKFIAMKTSRNYLQELQSKLAGVEEGEKIEFQMDQTVLKRVEALSSLCTVKIVKRH